ncbi:MAG TPA: twin-arginine translocation signal domain-containing protein, partial [Thermoanaerobaculia bacterium]|nr:twin-arginine translocation signal domain-containing protein [Thermoanaerobaculia bacterium]
MSNQDRKITRRKFVKVTGGAAAAAGLTSAFLFPTRALAQQKTLKIMQWSHFVPGYDKWFDGTFTKEWGARHNTNVVVDHISATEINARAAAEVAAKKGHDLFMFISPPAAYEQQVIDHREIYEEAQKKHGKAIDLAIKSTFNPKTKKYFSFSDAYVPDPGNYRQDLWAQAGFPHGPDSYADLLTGGKRIRQKSGNPVGLGLSQETDTNMALRAMLWSFGGAEQNEAGQVTLYSKQTID